MVSKACLLIHQLNPRYCTEDGLSHTSSGMFDEKLTTKLTLTRIVRVVYCRQHNLNGLSRLCSEWRPTSNISGTPLRRRAHRVVLRGLVAIVCGAAHLSLGCPYIM